MLTTLNTVKSKTYARCGYCHRLTKRYYQSKKLAQAFCDDNCFFTYTFPRDSVNLSRCTRNNVLNADQCNKILSLTDYPEFLKQIWQHSLYAIFITRDGRFLRLQNYAREAEDSYVIKINCITFTSFVRAQNLIKKINESYIHDQLVKYEQVLLKYYKKLTYRKKTTDAYRIDIVGDYDAMIWDLKQSYIPQIKTWLRDGIEFYNEWGFTYVVPPKK